MSLLVIDYGMGNLGSIKRSLEECGADVIVSDNPNDLESASLIVFPGVGAFKDGMKKLQERGWIDKIKKAVQEDKIPFLGICLGMQLLAETGYEGGKTQGLGLIPGEVNLLKADSAETRIPHIGWNEVNLTKDNPLFSGINNKTDFYFMHSYHFIPVQPDHILATTPYCGSFVAAVSSGNIFGVQFHPEKSSRSGFQLLRNFIKF